MIKRALVLILAVMILALPALATEYTVSFNQIVEHPALDALRQGIKDELTDQGMK